VKREVNEEEKDLIWMKEMGLGWRIMKELKKKKIIRAPRKVVDVQTLSPSKEKLFNIVTKKISKWIKRNQNNLPKTVPKFQKTIESFCVLRKRVLTAEYIIEFLKNDCYITVDNDESLYLLRNKVGYYNINEIKNDILTSVQKEVLLKCIEWLVGLQTIPSKMEGLINCLDQMCIYKFRLSNRDVLNALLDKKFIEVGEEDSITFNIT